MDSRAATNRAYVPFGMPCASGAVMLSFVSSTDKSWWKTLDGAPSWMTTADEPWHGWAFASAALMFFGLVLIVAPKHVIVGPMAAASVIALCQAVGVRNGSQH